MNAIDWLIYANIAVWVGLCGYIFFIVYKQTKIEQQLNKIECIHYDQ